MKTFLFTGDIRHAGRIKIEAETVEEAFKKMENGDFSIWDEEHKNLGFDHNGEDPEDIT